MKNIIGPVVAIIVFVIFPAYMIYSIADLWINRPIPQEVKTVYLPSENQKILLKITASCTVEKDKPLSNEACSSNILIKLKENE